MKEVKGPLDAWKHWFFRQGQQPREVGEQLWLAMTQEEREEAKRLMATSPALSKALGASPVQQAPQEVKSALVPLSPREARELQRQAEMQAMKAKEQRSPMEAKPGEEVIPDPYNFAWATIEEDMVQRGKWVRTPEGRVVAAQKDEAKSGGIDDGKKGWCWYRKTRIPDDEMVAMWSPFGGAVTVHKAWSMDALSAGYQHLPDLEPWEQRRLVEASRVEAERAWARERKTS